MKLYAFAARCLPRFTDYFVDDRGRRAKLTRATAFCLTMLSRVPLFNTAPWVQDRGPAALWVHSWRQVAVAKLAAPQAAEGGSLPRLPGCRALTFLRQMQVSSRRCRPRTFVCALFNRRIQREFFFVFSLFVFRVVHVIERIIYDVKWRVLSHQPTGQGGQLKHLQ